MTEHRIAGTLPLQPRPAEVSLITTPDRRWTSLVRRWRPGDSSLCKLCPKGQCSASKDVCHLVIEGEVRPGKAALYSVPSVEDGGGLVRMFGGD